MLLRVLVDGVAEVVWCLATSDEVIEDGDKLAKDKIHQRKQNSSRHHTDDCYGCRDPPYGIIVREDTLAAVSQAGPKTMLTSKGETHNIAIP